MKTINVREIDEIKISTKDKEYICSFNMLSMAYIQEQLAFIKKEWIDLSPGDLCRLVLYGGIRANDEDFTYEDAGVIARAMSPGAYVEIMNAYHSSVMSDLDKKKQSEIKKLTAQYMAKHQR